MEPVQVYYSYAHKDEIFRRELEKHLSNLRQQGFIQEWHDRMIVAGADWAFDIDTHLNSASIILLLVSPDFMTSDYCLSIEMMRAMELHEARKAYVIPILLRPVDWEGAPFAKLQVLPTGARPISVWDDLDEAFLNVNRGIRQVIELLHSNHFAGVAYDVQDITRLNDGQMSYFMSLEDYLKSSHLRFPTQDDFARNLVYVPEKKRDEITYILDEKRRVLLMGPQATGKTVLAIALAKHLYEDERYKVAYQSIENAQEGEGRKWYQLIRAHDRERVLYILDNCHLASEEVNEFCLQWEERPPKYAQCLLISRAYTGGEDASQALYYYFEACVDATFKTYSGDIYRSMIESSEYGFVHVQTEEYISRHLTMWYQKSLNTAYLSKNIQKDLNSLIKIIHTNTHLYALAINPLLLTVIAEVYRYQGQLPATRTLLYKSITNRVLERWFITDISWTRENIKSCIAHLAMFLPRQAVEEITEPSNSSETIHLITTETLVPTITQFLEEIKLPKEDAKRHAEAYHFVDLIRETSGIIVEYSENLFNFVHRTFQDYFAAVYLYERHHNTFNDLHDFLTRYLNNLQWREVIFFLFEMLEPTTVNKLLYSVLSIHNDEFSPYERGLDYLSEQLVAIPLAHQEIRLLQLRLERNIAEARKYGSEATQKSELNRILDSLNDLSLQNTRKSFNEWCKWDPLVQQSATPKKKHKKLNILLFIGSCLCEELIIENFLANRVINELGQQTFNAATANQREQAALMLSRIARTRQYGELGQGQLEVLEQRKRLEQRRELLQQQISMLKSSFTQMQMAYQQHQHELDVLRHQSDQLHFELAQFRKQEASSSDLKMLLASQDKLQTQIVQVNQIIAMLTSELHLQEAQFANIEHQFQSIEQKIELLPIEQALREPEDSDQQKLQQQRNETLQQISSARERLNRTQVEYSYRRKDLAQLHLQIEQLYSEQAKFRQQGISSVKFEELFSFSSKLRKQIEHSKYIIDTLSQELQVQEKQLKDAEYQLESTERELQISRQVSETTQTKQTLPELEQHEEEHIVTTAVVQQIPVHRYYIYLEGPEHRAQIGQLLTFTLHFLPTQKEKSELLLLPINAQEIGIYLEAPGFYLEGEHLRSLLVVDGRPAKTTLEFQCKPVLSGEQTLHILLYPGGSQAREQSPTILALSVSVLVPTILPPVPELIDQRIIPDPQPDIELVVILEELRNTQQLQIYCTCPILHMERTVLGALSLSIVDIACLRQTVIQYANELCTLSPSDIQQSLRQLGAMLFDQLIPSGHTLHTTYWKLRSLSLIRDMPLSLLIISDEQALLPWELVCPYEQQSLSNEIVYDDFLADSFVLSHWVARQGLSLQAEAPIGWLALDHYHQHPQFLRHWHAILSDERFDEADQPLEGLLALQEPKLPYYGLHILRYHDPDEETRITARDTKLGELLAGHNDAEKMTYERRLDFTRKHPIICLSLVEIEVSPYFRRASQHDTQLEAGWYIPFMHAGASALIGTRWPVLPEVDQLFFRTFYTMIRRGVSLGWAVGAARAHVKQAFPTRPDWLAYTYFGHPLCTPYLVQPAQGFTLFEALHHSEEDPFTCGESYQFLASYRSEAPLWYNGHLQMQQTTLHGENVSIMVIPLNDNNIQTYPLAQVQSSNDYQRLITLTMPQEETTYPVMIRFQRGKKELQTFILHLDVVAQGGKGSDESSM